MIYATSDLHGYPFEKFQELLKKADFSKNDFLFVLGDVIDRGTDGIKILKWMMRQPNVELILGNHEAMMLSCDFLFDEITEDAIARLTGKKLDCYSNWVANGGHQTVSSLCSMRPEEAKYIVEYLRDAPLYETVSVNGRDFLLTHSGLGSFHKDKALSDYSSMDFLWSRPRLNDRYFDDITTVFGHTPTLYYGYEFKGRAVITPTWIDIDTGAACNLAPMLLRLDDLKQFYVDKTNY